MKFITPVRSVFAVGVFRVPSGSADMGGQAETADASRSKMNRQDRLIQLYDQLRPALLAYLGGLGLSLPEAEDILQEAFVRLFSRVVTKGEQEYPKAWLFRVAHNLTMDLYRDGQRFARPDTDGIDPLEGLLALGDNPEEQVIRNEQALRMHAALGRLTQQQRAAVLLRAEDLRYREIAEILDISITRVSHLIQRALSRLAGEI